MENTTNAFNDLNGSVGEKIDAEAKKLLAAKIEEDVLQYLSVGGKIWENKAVKVIVENDDAFVTWKNHQMPTMDFYKFVVKNNGVVSPEDFESY